MRNPCNIFATLLYILDVSNYSKIKSLFRKKASQPIRWFILCLVLSLVLHFLLLPFPFKFSTFNFKDAYDHL